MSLDFHKLKVDHCTYFYNYNDGNFCILVLYVDDMIVVSNNKHCIFMLKA